MNKLSKIYTFDDFQFDTDRLALYHRTNLVKNSDKKTMQVLAVLLLNPNRLTTHEEIIEKVWQDNPLGVTSGHIGQYISLLRKIFAELAPEKQFIETVKGRGYSFKGNIFLDDAQIEESVETALPTDAANIPESVQISGEKSALRFNLRQATIAFSLLILALLTIFAAWTRFAKNDEEEIRRVVKESQLYESLVLYKNPAMFDETQLDKYWMAELDHTLNADRRRIREAVKKLDNEGRRYGDETRCEQFEFQSVEINQNRDFAVVKTLEKWFIAVYFNDGTLQRNKYVGPYFVSYLVRKSNGRWLIEKSNTARVNRPIPRLSGIETLSEIKPEQQFFVKLNGQDFEAETVHIEIFGEGCPESNPCRISNITLRENSKISETFLENVPLTLSSGIFRITVRNGDSRGSNSVDLEVP